MPCRSGRSPASPRSRSTHSRETAPGRQRAQLRKEARAPSTSQKHDPAYLPELVLDWELATVGSLAALHSRNQRSVCVAIELLGQGIAAIGNVSREEALVHS